MRFEFSEPHRWFRSALAVAAVLCLALVTVLSVSSFAQQISGDITGTVLDEQGLGVPNASVDATNTATGVKTSTKATDKGEYRLSNLPVGTYNLSASAANFAPTSLKGIVVDLSKTTTANLTLKVGVVETTVEVTGMAPLIDTTTAQLQTNYGEVYSQQLPMTSLGQGGGVLNLSLLSPNVTNASDMGLGAGPAIGGLRPRNNNFMIEGVDNNNKTVTGALTSVPNDAVAEFTLLTNQFNADFGHSSGGQFNTVVKSGSNSFHGSLYEYARNRNFDAIDAVYARQTPAGEVPKNPRYDNNRYGGTFGGPILKDKLFFFSNFEKEPIGLVASAGSAVFAPTAAGIATLNGIKGLSSTNLSVFEKYVPVAPAQSSTCGASGGGKGTSPCFITVGGSAIPTGVVPIENSAWQNNENFVQSVDWNASAKDQVRGRYIYNQVVGPDTASQQSVFFSTIPNTFHLVNISEFHTFSPSVSNEFRTGFNRFAQNFPVPNIVFPGLNVFPNITLLDLGGGLNIGPDPNAPQFTIQNFYQVLDNISWVKGKHSLKFGVEGRKYISPQGFTQRARGDYEYNSTATFLQDLSPDNFGQRSTGSTTYYGDQTGIYWFANDTWKVTSHLSVNAGIRYEYMSIPVGEQRQALNNLASQPQINVPMGGPFVFTRINAPKNEFSPRLGFAYSPGKSGTTSIRAGFSLSHDVLYDNIGILAPPPQIGSTLNCGVPTVPQCPSTASPSPNFFANGALPGGGSGISVLSLSDAINSTSDWIPPNQRWPYSIQWNLGVQHSFGKDYTLDVRYLGTRGNHLDLQNIITQRAVVTPTHNLPTYLQRPTQATLDALPLTLAGLEQEDNCLSQYEVSPAASFCFVTAFLPEGWSRYHGLSTQLTRRMSNGLMFIASHTWSRTIDNSTADFHSTDLTQRRPQDFLNLGSEKAVSALNRNNRLTLAIVYDAPFFKSNSSWLMKNVLGNWLISPVYTYESPEYFMAQSAEDANLNGDSAGDHVIFNKSGVPGTGTDVTPLKNSGGDVVAYLANNPNAQYIRAAPGAFANGARNTIKGDSTNNVDLGVSKRVSFSERWNVEFGAQLANVLNHPQFLATNPATAGQGFGVNDVLGNFTTTGGTYKNYLTPGKATFNQPSLVFPSNSRTMGLVLKLHF